VASDGWEGLAEVPGAIVGYRQRRLFAREMNEERRNADAHWKLHRRTPSAWTLRNTGPDTAHDLALVIRTSGYLVIPIGRRVALALAARFRLHRWSERLELSTPMATSHAVATAAADPIPPGKTIELTFERPSDTAWLEVEWLSPDGDSHWAKYPLPAPQTPAATE
jgi:hypothetical protein